MSDTGLAAFRVTRETQPLVEARQRQLNSRTVEPMDPLIVETAQKNQVFVFNVGPWPHRVPMGSLGQHSIAACPEGKEYSEPLVFDGLVSELYPETEVSMKRHLWNGRYLAEQFLGVGAHNPPQNSLVRYGCAIANQWPPTKDEIAAAKKALYEGELKSLINEADAAAAEGPRAVEATIRDRHQVAARILKLSVAEHPWMGRVMQAAEREGCKFCGEPMKKGLARCPNCKEIIDQKLYDKLKGGGEAKS